ncbi:MAG: BatA domain-containing protein [Verrucomicrobiota bacterium]
MTFLSPAFLWTLLALLPLGAVYFLKVRPRRKTTTAYFLWEKIFSEKKASSLFNRLRDLLSLLIMALAFGAIAFALARPEFSADERKDLLILIDESASMSAQD